MKALHCDQCDSWARRNGVAADEFYTLTTAGHQWHFCTLDCCMRFAAANSEPTEEMAI